jgi:hypothetical protein
MTRSMAERPLGSRVLAHAGSPDEIAMTLLILAGVCAGWLAWSRLRGDGVRWMPRFAAIILVPVAALALVGSVVVPTMFRPPSPARATGARPTSTASLAFRAPRPGATVAAGELPVVLRLTGGRVLTEATTDLRPDEGHIHLSLDGRLVSMTYGTMQTVDLRSLRPGAHELRAEFVAADHGPFSPRVTASVRFETAP